jgi:ABC-type uncharacterized transport system ATPase subunit
MSSEKLKELKKRYGEVKIIWEDLRQKYYEKIKIKEEIKKKEEIEKIFEEMKKLKEKKIEILNQIKKEEHIITFKSQIGIKK